MTSLDANAAVTAGRRCHEMQYDDCHPQVPDSALGHRAPHRHTGKHPPTLERPHVASHELKKAYGDRLAVNGLSLQVNRGGEIAGLLGPNGAGKSTTVSMIAGLASPSEGRVTWMACPCRESGVRRPSAWPRKSCHL